MQWANSANICNAASAARCGRGAHDAGHVGDRAATIQPTRAKIIAAIGTGKYRFTHSGPYTQLR